MFLQKPFIKHIRNQSTQKGFSLLEMVISLTLVSILSTVVYGSFRSLDNRQILNKEVDQVKAYVQKARINSLNSKNADIHGILFATTSITTIEVLASSTIYTYTLNNRVRLSASTLGTSTLTFARISGLPNATGTLTYVYVAGNTVIGSSTITINGLGVTE